jgi:hypothetical protein
VNAKSRKRNKSTERRDWYVLVHRIQDKRSVAQCVRDGIEIAVGNPLLADMTGTIY